MSAEGEFTVKQPNRFSQNPAKPTFFAGRKGEIEAFRKSAINTALLDPAMPENFSILGEWGMGKTSLLDEFEHIVLNELGQSINCVSFYLPLHPNICKSWESFSIHLIKIIKRKIESNKGGLKLKIKEELKKWEPTVGISGTNVRRKIKESPIDLSNSLEELWTEYLKPQKISVAFIFIDDFHYLPAVKDDDLFMNLRTTIQYLVKKECNYSLIVAATSSMYTDAVEIGDPINRFFKKHRLRNFTLDETKEAVTKRVGTDTHSLRIKERVIEEVYRKTGGNPYITMFTMHELIENVNTQDIDLELFNLKWDGIKHSIWESEFYGVLRELPKEERDLLIRISNGTLKESPYLSYSDNEENVAFIDSLVRRGLILKIMKGKYRIFNQFFEDYLRDSKEMERFEV